ncbi:MAG: DUF4388 domain-containing protein [Limisphaerales bacterium]
MDDDVDWLNLCNEMFAHLPSKPEIRTVASGARALALMETEPFRLLVCDLKMPRMDGLQVLSIVRRRFPELRTIVLSGLEDEEFRSRAYALGVDLFWLKTDMQANSQMFLDCIESLLGRDMEGGFRGIQSKSLMDIIQMECLSRSSTVLRITRGPLVARLWIQNGELIDAETEGARGEAAFYRILAWKSGTFENLPAEPERERTITKPVNALLLESAQTIDETADSIEPGSIEQTAHRKTIWKLAQLTREGAEFVIVVPPEGQGEIETMGTQPSEPLAKWARRAVETAKRLGERIEAGPLSHVAGHNLERQMLVLNQENKCFLVGWPPNVAAGPLLEKSKKLVSSWDSENDFSVPVRQSSNCRPGVSPWTAMAALSRTPSRPPIPRRCCATSGRKCCPSSARRARRKCRWPKSAFISPACTSPPANCAAAPSFSCSHKPLFPR